MGNETEEKDESDVELGEIKMSVDVEEREITFLLAGSCKRFILKFGDEGIFIRKQEGRQNGRRSYFLERTYKNSENLLNANECLVMDWDTVIESDESDDEVIFGFW